MQYDITIVGAGIVGLATAFQLQRRRPDLRLLVLEKEDRVAAHQSGHNSGVIHSGIYYPPGGTRAVHCRRGYRLLLDFCDEYDISYTLTGKLIVAVHDGERERLQTIFERGHANGLDNLRMLSAGEMREYEPEAGGVAAIHVPQAGIIHYPTVAAKYAELVRVGGGTLQFGAKVSRVLAQSDGWVLETTQGDFSTRFLVTCGGLYSDHLTRLTMPEVQTRILPFRGEYYRLRPEREDLVRGLIYPVPNPSFPFLGVHLTRMQEGGVEAGPNAVLAFAREGYHRNIVNWRELSDTLRFPGFRRIARRYWRDGWLEMRRSFSKQAFYEALRPLLPALQIDDLLPAGAGVRAMACDPEGNLIDDYLFHEKPGVLNVANAPSPAATASLAIGETVAERVLGAVGGGGG